MQRLSLSLILLMSLVLPVFYPGFAEAAKLKVFVSILPQQYLVERIGGDRVEVTSMVRAGARPETYEPTPKQMAALSNTSIYFRIGVPFEDVWMDKIRDQNPAMKIIDCCREYKSGNASDHSDEGYYDDRHIWTSPLIGITLSEQIRDVFIEEDPDHQFTYEQNFSSLKQDLQDLDKYIREQLGPLRHRFIIVSHPAWGYYANTYNLEQVAIEQHGSEVRARSLVELVELARKENIRTIYVQKQFNPASAEILAREINGRLVELDPLAPDYIENLRQVTRQIAEGTQ